ncbi:MAG: DsbE family thiol:disulfide interchange protein [Piscirickettsiaceae bacterium]|nr:DsbE family thiol:disulfide interchange protein [Piscirickettsiaceae bacterium]
MSRFFPLGIFLVLTLLLFVGLSKDPKQIPSPLIGKPVPKFQLELLADPQQKEEHTIFNQQITLLNVWATWCVACRAEHEQLLQLAKRGVRIVGLNYKDERSSALAWLSELGDPYEMTLFDPNGRVSIDWGVYGTPETFIIDQQGIIRYKHIGPISKQDVEQIILPLIRELQL